MFYHIWNWDQAQVDNVLNRFEQMNFHLLVIDFEAWISQVYLYCWAVSFQEPSGQLEKPYNCTLQKVGVAMRLDDDPS